MKRFLLLLFVLITGVSQAQQDAQYSQYMFNTLVINPAYAGYKESLNVSLLHRDQWTGISGAPTTQSIVLDKALATDNKVGLGFSVVNDKYGLLGQTSAHINYAYRLPVGEDDSRLSFGIAAGIIQYRVDNSSAIVEDPEDPNFLGGGQSNIGPDGKFGVYYANSKFYSGFSVTNILSRAVKYSTGQGAILKQGRHYFFTGGYLANLSENFKLKPSFLIREDMKSPTNIDLNTFLLINETVWIGASYRSSVNLWKKSSWNNATFNQNSMVGAMELMLAQKFRIGYAYDYSLSDIRSSTNGSHEISIGFVLEANKKNTALLTPRYF